MPQSMPVVIKDALSKLKKSLPENVSLYTCGHTAYDAPHLGNMRTVVVFDMLVRYLKLRGHTVKYIRNTTDIDDKIIQNASAQNIAIDALVKSASDAHDVAEAALGCTPPDVNPYATEYIAEMIGVINVLLEKGLAYAAGGHILFKVPNDQLDFYPTECRASSDLDASYKGDPRDFVLWKPSKHGEPVWDSPYGPGRPGWHTECVAMILANICDVSNLQDCDFGGTLTIHGGGCDLMFPHHANELLQLKACGVVPEIWMHNGMLQNARGGKISKSEVGRERISALDWVTRVPGVIIRIALLMTKYSHPLLFTINKLKQAELIWHQIAANLQDTSDLSAVVPDSVVDILANDLNTAGTFAEIKTMSAIQLAGFAELMGLLQAEHRPINLPVEKVEGLVEQYKALGKDFQEGEKIKQLLLDEYGVKILPNGSWVCGIPGNLDLKWFE
jgi:cysteinyl-tRNA synthetase